MNCNVLATGSTGNAVVLNGNLLIDCGVPYSTIECAMRELKMVLLTHEHSDHFKPTTIRKLAAERPTLRWACCEWLVPKLVKCVNRKNIDVFVPDHYYQFGEYIFSPIRLTHSVPNCGWRIFHGDEKTFYATDTGNLNGITAPCYDNYLIEANYDEDDLQRRIDQKLKEGKFAYEAKAELNHLSTRQTVEWLGANAGPQSKVKYLHQHKEKECIK